MALFTRKPDPAPTHEERIARASDKANMVYTVFESMASDLYDAAAEHDSVASDAQAKRDEADRIIRIAEAEKERAFRLARRIGALLDAEE